jgi:hypothetical protein
LRVHAKGTKSFFFDYRLDGRTKRIAIGKYSGPRGVWTARKRDVLALLASLLEGGATSNLA